MRVDIFDKDGETLVATLLVATTFDELGVDTPKNFVLAKILQKIFRALTFVGLEFESPKFTLIFLLLIVSKRQLNFEFRVQA